MASISCVLIIRVAMFSRPTHLSASVDSDWVLLKRMRIGLADPGSYPFIRHYVRSAVSWGWRSIFGPFEKPHQHPQQQQHPQLQQQLQQQQCGKGSKQGSNISLHSLFWSVAVLTGAVLSYVILMHQV